MKYLILNDVHIGAVRTAGTTLQSRLDIQNYLQSSLATILMDHQDKDLIINGDLFDAFDVDMGQLLTCYLTFDTWLRSSQQKLHLVLGNHDIAKNSLKTSSFAFLCKLLKNAYPSQVIIHDDGLSKIDHNVYVIPHCVNQDLFELELAEAMLLEEPSHILFHANVDNNFAVEADHSLNVSEDWLRKLTKKGHTLLFAHEHQARTLMAGQVVVLGNQWPTSVADCLAHGDAQKDGKKYAHILYTEMDQASGKDVILIDKVQTWQAEGDYTEMNWRDLQPTDHRFIRISGEAKSDESADVISTIARFRQTSQALVITNAVKVDGIAGIDGMKDMAAENLRAVNVLEALLEELTEPERVVVKELLAGREQ